MRATRFNVYFVIRFKLTNIHTERGITAFAATLSFIHMFNDFVIPYLLFFILTLWHSWHTLLSPFYSLYPVPHLYPKLVLYLYPTCIVAYFYLVLFVNCLRCGDFSNCVRAAYTIYIFILYTKSQISQPKSNYFC